MSDLRKEIFGRIKVVEMATFVAAPAAGKFFADLGAEVIKIEPAGGDPIRDTAAGEGRPVDPYEDITWDVENGGKKSVSFNLKDARGKEALFRLLEQADVLITNWRTDALERAGLDYESLKVKFPKLVFSQITGYGDKGPDKDLPGFDLTAFAARGGWLGTLYERDASPLVPIGGLGDHQAGLMLAAGTMTALYKAEKTGKGDRVTVSLLSAAIFGVTLFAQAAQYGVTSYPINRDEILNPLINAYKSKDGRYIQVAMPMYDFYYPKFMALIGREDMIQNENFSKINNLGNRNKELFYIVKEAFLKKDMAEWKRLLTEGDIPFAVAQTWEEVLDDEQAWANDYLVKVDYPGGVQRTLIRQPIHYNEMGLPEAKKGPLIGEDSESVLAGLGYCAEEIQEMKANKIFTAWEKR